MRQIVLTTVFGDFAESLGRTFLSFAQNPFLELHAFVIGEQLPQKRFENVTYHLCKSDPAFSHPLREAYYRRWSFVDELDAEFALVVDNQDVLCLQPLPEIPALLRGATVGACVEHLGGRYLPGQQYTSSYLNAGVTFWHVPSSRKMRAEIVERGRSHFRKLDDQHSFNEVVQTCYFDQLTILPSQYNYRAYLAPKRLRRWPTVANLDGVIIYHNSACIEAAKKLLPVKPKAELPDLPRDPAPLTPGQQRWRRIQERLKPHIVEAGLIRRILSPD